MKILVLGGTGVISRAIVTEGMKEGHQMITLNRGLRQVAFETPPETLVADWTDAEQYRQRTAGLRVDAVIDVLSRTPQDARRTLDCFGGRAYHWIFTSTTSAYAKPYAAYPIRESEARLWQDTGFDYAYQKARMEEYLMERAQREGLHITIIRPSLTYGDGCRNIGVLRQNENIVHRIRRGKPLLLYDDGKTVFTFTFAPDVARGYLGCAGNPAAYGQAFHVTSRNCISMEGLYRAFGRIAGAEPTFRYLPSETLFRLDPEQFNHIWYEKRFDHIFSLDKLRQAVPSYEPHISLETGLRHMTGWWRKQGFGVDAEKDALEDRLCAMGETRR